MLKVQANRKTEKRMLDEKNLNLAGWLSIIAAGLIIPGLAISLSLEMAKEKSFALLSLEGLYNIGYGLISVYLFVMFKRLLNQKASFHEVDTYINLLIWLTIAHMALNVIALPFTEAKELLEMGMYFLLIPIGLIHVVFGAKLLKSEDNLFGYLKPLSYLTIATGIMMALIVLALFAMITCIIGNVILALVFFKSAKLIQTQGSLSPKWDQSMVNDKLMASNKYAS